MPSDTHFASGRRHADALLHEGRLQEGVDAYRTCIADDPADAELRLALGSALSRLGRHEEAIEQLEKALSLEPGLLPALGNLAEALGAAGRHEAAAACFKRVIEARPEMGLAHYNYGTAKLVLGDLAGARSALERAVTLMPRDAAAHRVLAGLKTFREGDPQLAALEALARGEPFLPDDARVDLNFALAKACEDLGDDDRAFRHLQRGNALKRRLVRYDEAAELAVLRDMAGAFTSELLRAKAGLGDPSEVPVFVVGMPRSGTTLVERILSGHPRVFGAGELTAFGDAAAGGYAPKPLPFDPEVLDERALRGIARRYLDEVVPKAPAARRIIDKLPANFRFAGLMHLVFPNARIVHVRRDPLDTCFSCYAQLFVRNLEYTYDLGELGRYFQAYAALMAHWREVLPGKQMLEVDYEELVGDLEAQARRLITFCGLQWDQRCLRFHEAPGAVQTASAAQVRRPLYRTSVGRARRFEAHLGPLKAILAAS